MKLLAKTIDSIPLIFLVTDGAVEDEKQICNNMIDYLKSNQSICPRISTFGIGELFDFGVSLVVNLLFLILMFLVQ